MATIEEAFRVLKRSWSMMQDSVSYQPWHHQRRQRHPTKTPTKMLSPTVAHKMASLTPTTELCRRHIAGLCTNGSSCKYSHASAPPNKGAPSDKKPNKNPPPLKKDQKTRSFLSRNRSSCQIPTDHLLDIPKELQRRRTQLDIR